LYDVYLLSSAKATVAELAATLQADLYQLEAHALFACRLGWAVNFMDANSVLNDKGAPAFPSTILSDDEPLLFPQKKKYQLKRNLGNN
jgi:hypothetical protein